jgi:tight adherence protein C
MIVNLLSLLAFLVVALTVFLIGSMVTASGETPDVSITRDRKASWLIRALARAVPQLPSEIETIGRDLKRAGNYRRSALDEYLATRNALILGTLILTMAAALVLRRDVQLLQFTVITGFVLAIGAYGLPRLYLNWIADRRVERIQAGLPDALDMMTMCLTGGMPLYDALQRVSVEVRDNYVDVAAEFDIIRRQASAGSMGQALQYFAARVDAPDIRALSSIVAQTERLGTSVAVAVRDYAESVRDTRRQRAVERANKMSVQLMLPIIFCLAPPVYVLLCAPPILELVDFFGDNSVLGGSEETVRSLGNTGASGNQ